MKNRLTHNLGLKILSVVVAALIWLAIMNIDDPVVTVSFNNIPVQIVNDEVITSRGYQYSVESGETTDIKVKGKRTIIDTLKESDFSATADFNTLNSMYMVTINVDCTAERADELIVTLKTETMAIKKEEQDTQPFSVRIISTGDVKEGYYCYDTKASSTLIQLTGSLTQINAVREVVAYVNIDGKMSDFTVSSELKALDENGEEIDSKKLSFSQDFVTVSVGICPTAEIPLTVNAIGEPAAGYYVGGVEYAPSTVLVAAKQELLDKLRSIIIPCDISKAKENVEQQVNLAEYINSNLGDDYIAVNSPTLGIVVTVNKMAVKNFDITENDISAKSLNENLEYSIYSMWNSSVTISGREEELEDLLVSDLGLYVDLTGCAVGTYSRQIRSDALGDMLMDAGAVMVKVTEKQEN